MSRSICFADTLFLTLHMIATAIIHLLSGKRVPLKIVPVVTRELILALRIEALIHEPIRLRLYGAVSIFASFAFYGQLRNFIVIAFEAFDAIRPASRFEVQMAVFFVAKAFAVSIRLAPNLAVDRGSVLIHDSDFKEWRRRVCPVPRRRIPEANTSWIFRKSQWPLFVEPSVGG